MAEPADRSGHGFQPEDHLAIVNGGAYLPTAWRIVWLREVAPDSAIETEVVSITDDAALVKATVQVVTTDGAISAKGTGHGYQTKEGWASFVEAAETKAIGRALAACGYGTQFCGQDFEDTTGAVLADTPVKGQISTATVQNDRGEVIAQARGGFTSPERPAQPSPAPFDDEPPDMPPPDDYPPINYDEIPVTTPPITTAGAPVRRAQTVQVEIEEDGERRTITVQRRTTPPDRVMSERAVSFFYRLCDQHNVREQDIRSAIHKHIRIDPPEEYGKMLDVLTPREGVILTNDWLKPHIGFEERER